MASSGQTSTQISQPRHSLIFIGSGLPFTISNTCAGHDSTHSSSPLHFSQSISNCHMRSFLCGTFCFYFYSQRTQFLQRSRSYSFIISQHFRLAIKSLWALRRSPDMNFTNDYSKSMPYELHAGGVKRNTHMPSVHVTGYGSGGTL